MSDTFYILLAFGLTYVVLGVYVLRMRAQWREVTIEAEKRGAE